MNESQLWTQISQLQPRNLEALMRFLKQAALDHMEQTPGLEISVPGAHDKILLRKFNNEAEKRAFIAKHRQNGEWGDDSILLPFLNKLGYQPFFHLNLSRTELPPYLAFESPNADKVIHISNSGAAEDGYQWELLAADKSGSLQKISNQGGGNCMYWAIAQQVLLDLPKVEKQLSLPPVQITEPTPQVQEQVTQAKVAWIKYEAEDSQLRENMKEHLQKVLVNYSNDDLKLLFNSAIVRCDKDSYIMSRIDQIDSYTNAELIDVLGTEAWRNINFRNYLESTDKHVIFNVAEKQSNAIQDLNTYSNQLDPKTSTEHLSSLSKNQIDLDESTRPVKRAKLG